MYQLVYSFHQILNASMHYFFAYCFFFPLLWGLQLHTDSTDWNFPSDDDALFFVRFIYLFSLVFFLFFFLEILNSLIFYSSLCNLLLIPFGLSFLIVQCILSCSILHHAVIVLYTCWFVIWLLKAEKAHISMPQILKELKISSVLSLYVIVSKVRR